VRSSAVGFAGAASDMSSAMADGVDAVEAPKSGWSLLGLESASESNQLLCDVDGVRHAKW
jgi:hypothetical protein